MFQKKSPKQIIEEYNNMNLKDIIDSILYKIDSVDLEPDSQEYLDSLKDTNGQKHTKK